MGKILHFMFFHRLMGKPYLYYAGNFYTSNWISEACLEEKQNKVRVYIGKECQYNVETPWNLSVVKEKFI